MGVGKDGEKKPSYQPSMELRGKYTILSEGCRGHLGKQIIKKFKLDDGKDPQHYGIGFKEIWDIKPDLHKEGQLCILLVGQQRNSLGFLLLPW